MAYAPQPVRGFTLIELMVTVAIIAILAAIALPSYRQYIIRGNRSAAEAAMMDIANRQQQFFMANRGYAANIAVLNYALPGDVAQNYTCNVETGKTTTTAASTIPSFLITCTPTGGQLSDGELKLDNNGAKVPLAKWKG
jgi:type IV pilus assembly protein PilE